jgi:hypothetical protein
MVVTTHGLPNEERKDLMTERDPTKAETKRSSGDLTLSAEYLALNVLNSGEMTYAKEAIEAALRAERMRCVRIVGQCFRQADDHRVEQAIHDIENGSQPW